VIVSIWIVVAGANLLLSFLGASGGKDALTMLGTNLTGLLVALVLSSVINRLMRDRTRPNWPALALVATFGGITVWLADGAFQFWASHPFGTPPMDAFLPVRYNLVYFLLIFALQTAALALLSANDELARRERQLAEATVSEQRARLAVLQLQLNPHFLFNALNALATLSAEGRSEEVTSMTGRLSDFLRIALSSSPQDASTLADELDAVQAYLDIEAVRFGSKLVVKFECQPELGSAAVPGLILQPLVENAVKHAVAPSTTPVTVEIGASAASEMLILEVTDSGSGGLASPAPTGFGIGLRNVSSRLQTLYGSKASLDFGPSGAGHKVVIRLPLIQAAAT
jgi:uncharacterized membrane protein YhaH (DUF805 family)